MNVGLTLLAVIFLTVMAAAAGVRSNQAKASVSPHGETLAVLGVAPGSGDAAKQSGPHATASSSHSR